ncbi:hypothetical protein KDI_30820 [Dictyobacter arantiisoli]|uniref:Uncharacterized protein n=1 Tax=Dictyobacter arantiisoli TaxID=2014874 RepID=A0A5A5TDZ8_9CHLR|nr:hypothetical protein KDI_30820 [Dictyobacter arantiisoli]
MLRCYQNLRPATSGQEAQNPCKFYHFLYAKKLAVPVSFYLQQESRVLLSEVRGFSYRTGPSLAFDGASQDTSDEVALEGEEDDERQSHGEEGGRGQDGIV